MKTHWHIDITVDKGMKTHSHIDITIDVWDESS